MSIFSPGPLWQPPPIDPNTQRRDVKRLTGQNGEYHDVWRDTVGGVPVMALHHMPATGRQWLLSGALSMELANHQLAEMRAGRTPPRTLVMSHRHVFAEYWIGDEKAIALPAWQALTRYGHKVVRANNCATGAVLLEFKGDGAVFLY